MLIASVKIEESDRNILPSSFYNPFSHKCQPYLTSSRVLLYAPGLPERNKEAG